VGGKRGGKKGPKNALNGWVTSIDLPGLPCASREKGERARSSDRKTWKEKRLAFHPRRPVEIKSEGAWKRPDVGVRSGKRGGRGVWRLCGFEGPS